MWPVLFQVKYRPIIIYPVISQVKYRSINLPSYIPS